MWTHLYVNEKLRELEREVARRTFRPQPPRRKPVVGPAVRAAGGALRRLGEGLESWAAPTAADADGLRAVSDRPEAA
ncbi:MAG: hypothetical protein HYY03_01590 [Chloroflexi bacterium]|nr:hypothetical protein [Chloroflexota bacterium]